VSTGKPAEADVIANRYRLDAFIGQGGMGVVWAATDLETGSAVALKMLRWNTPSRPDLRRRLLREARAAMSIQHPNIVPVHAVFGTVDEEAPVIVMDLLQGETLGSRLRREEKLDLSETVKVLLPVVAAVAAAHASGVVHRDLKPDNIFLAVNDRGQTEIKVLDFGIAKITSAEGDSLESGTVTGTDALLGTPCYMAPEQGFGERDIDARADVWALGVILYECLSGGRPVEGENLGQVLKRLLREGITPLRRVAPGVPADVARLVDRMLVTEREDRLADLDEVANVLASSAKPLDGAHSITIRTNGEKPFPRPILWILAAVVMALVVFVLRPRPSTESSFVTPASAPVAVPAVAKGAERDPSPAPVVPPVPVAPAAAPVVPSAAPPVTKPLSRTPRSAQGSDPHSHPSSPRVIPASSSAATVPDGLAAKLPF